MGPYKVNRPQNISKNNTVLERPRAKPTIGISNFLHGAQQK